jgi:hypothetical protein
LSITLERHGLLLALRTQEAIWLLLVAVVVAAAAAVQVGCCLGRLPLAGVLFTRQQ